MPKEAEYNALLHEQEDECTLDCGCRLHRPIPGDPGCVAITFCPMHDAAKPLLAAAINARNIIADIQDKSEEEDEMYIQLREASAPFEPKSAIVNRKS